MSTIHTDLTQHPVVGPGRPLQRHPAGRYPHRVPARRRFPGPARRPGSIKLYPDKMKAYVDWLVRDDPTRIEHLTPIIVKNGTGVPGLAETVVQDLKAQGFTNVQNGGNAPRPKVQLTAAGRRAEAGAAAHRHPGHAAFPTRRPPPPSPSSWAFRPSSRATRSSRTTWAGRPTRSSPSHSARTTPTPRRPPPRPSRRTTRHS